MKEVALSQLLPAANDAVAAAGAKTSSGTGFADKLGELLTRVSADQVEAEQQAAALVSGDGDIVDTMIAVGRAELSMKYVVTLRNRAVEAYQEIMRLQV